jgi:hypothetical protein
MSTEKVTKQNGNLTIFNVIARFLVFGLIWCGVFHLYITILDTNWPYWLDLTMAFIGAFNVFGNSGLRKWFLNGL